jgi:hypothetical protein
MYLTMNLSEGPQMHIATKMKKLKGRPLAKVGVHSCLLRFRRLPHYRKSAPRAFNQCLHMALAAHGTKFTNQGLSYTFLSVVC